MANIDKPGAVRLIQEARRLRGIGVGGAEAAYRGALVCDPEATPASIELAELLQQQGRFTDALAVTAPLIQRRPANHGVLAAHAEALKGAERPDEARAIYQRAAEENPASAVASHNLAAALGDLARFEEAEARARQALSAGLDAPQTWLVLARALQGLGRGEESLAAFDQVLGRAPTDLDAHRERTQLVWMMTGDAGQALLSLDRAIEAYGAPAPLLEIKAIAAKFFGDLPLARATIAQAVSRMPGDPKVLVTAAHLAILTGDAAQGLRFSQMAMTVAPFSRWVKLNLCESLLAVGDAAAAAETAAELHAAEPLAQDALAYLATAWRLLGDDRYGALYDYQTLVMPSELDTPKGWANLDVFLADLAAVLERDHVYRSHPFQQSLLDGSQINNLVASNDPVIEALFEALAGPIERTLRALGTGADPVRSRNCFAARFQGVWSVRLRPGGGRHLNHVHPKGWLSSACYISVPGGVTTSTDKSGWLSFGEPGVATNPPLAAEWFVEPKPGRLVLFPSYMWHGVTPFGGEGSRLSVAFDLLPDATPR